MSFPDKVGVYLAAEHYGAYEARGMEPLAGSSSSAVDLLKKWSVPPPQVVVGPSGEVPIASLRGGSSSYIPTMVRAGVVGNCAIQSFGGASQSRPESRSFGIPTLGGQIVGCPAKDSKPHQKGGLSLGLPREPDSFQTPVGIAALSRDDGGARVPVSASQRALLKTLGALDTTRAVELSDDEIRRQFKM
jgi:hypothetical protein